MNNFLQNYFKLNENNTNLSTEIRAGITTFLTMSYIIIVNPLILKDAGMPFNAVIFATVMVSAISSILMGLYANLPFALAPGMGINAFFTYSLVHNGIPWQTALTCVLISGIIFIILSSFKIRESIVESIPIYLRQAIAAGIGIFLGFIGLKNAGIIVSSSSTLVKAGNFGLIQLIFLIGLIITASLIFKRIKGALIISIIITTLLVWLSSTISSSSYLKNTITMPHNLFSIPETSTFFKFNFKTIPLSLIAPIFTLLFTDMFDSISTFVGVSEVGGFIDKKTGMPKNVGKALLLMV